MTMGWVDGRFVASGQLPKPEAGRLAPFETMGAQQGQLPLWSRHLRRLRESAVRLGLAFDETPELRAAAGKLLVETGRFDGILRLALVPAGGGVHVVMTTRGRSPASTVRLAPTAVERSSAGPPADIKAFPRSFYDAVRQQAQDAGADDGLVVDEDGGALETATANLWALVGGQWRTPPLDGRILPGIARALLLERAPERGLAVREEALHLDELRDAEALAVSSAVYGPRAAGLTDGAPPAVSVVAASLGELWSEPAD